MGQHAIIDLLCRCLAPEADGALDSLLAGLAPADWDELILQMERHGLVPLFHYRLRSGHPGLRLPADIERKLKNDAHIGAGRNLCITRELSRILLALNRADIPVILLKGAHLAFLVYGSSELRQMGDVDIMIPVSHLARGGELLRELGYASLEDYQVEKERTWSQHLPLFTREGAVPVEIHWTIERPTSPYTVDLEGLWRRSQPVKLAGAEARVLAPEDLLLHVCLHAGYHHRFIVSLQVITDIAEILNRFQAEVCWSTVAERAAEWGAARPLHLCLLLARELIGAAVPEAWLRRLEPADFHPSVIAAARAQVESYAEQGEAVPRLSRADARLWGVRWSWGSPAFWLGRLFLPRRTLARKYPSAPNSRWAVLYYSVRARDLLLRVGRGAWGTVRHRKKRREAAGRERLLGIYLTRK